jgi:methylated-DNA-[protein]-cysteine S-methyltransferase
MSEKREWCVGWRGYSRAMTIRPLDRPLPEYLVRVPSPIGTLELTSDGEAVTSLSIERAGHVPLEGLPERADDVLARAARQLGEYFDGGRREFDVPVRLSGTPFQLAVWGELRSLAWGEVIFYGTIGAATGRATAGRAVGGAVGANPVPILVPCHRVLASDGRITGYSGGDGIPTKAWLLDHEGITHKTVISHTTLMPTGDSTDQLDIDDVAGAAESAAEDAVAARSTAAAEAPVSS